MTKIFKVPFADTGDKISPPDAIQPDGSVSYGLGYGFDYQRDTSLDSGGAPIDPLAKVFPREQHNGILNDITTAIGEIQINGFPIWQAAGAPYPVNSQVRHGTQTWRNLVDGNTLPPSESNNWSITSSRFVRNGDGLNIQLQEGVSNSIPVIFAAIDSTSIGNLWASSNFDPSKKLTGDWANEAGFVANSTASPYIRQSSTGNIVTLATKENADLTGTPVAPTAGAGVFSKQIANLEFVAEAVRRLLPKRGFSGNDFIRIPDQPGGLIIQWGRVAYTDISVSLSIPITLSTPFPTVNLGVIGNVESSAQNAYCTTTSRNLSSAVLNLTESSTAIASGTVFWIAIGN